MVEETIAWFAGVDWGSERHQACLVDAQGAIVGEREFPHSGKGLSELADWILSMTGIASAVAVAVEVPHGPVVDVLLDRGFIVHAINPKQLDRLRDRFSVAGAKDDRRDAYVSADGLRTDRHLFRRLQIADPRLIELRAWSRLAEELQEERVRLSNRLHQQLWRYYPQMLKLTDDLPPLGFSSCGSGRLHRQKEHGYACQRSSGCSSSIVFAACMARTFLEHCESPPLKCPMESRKQPVSTFAR